MIDTHCHLLPRLDDGPSDDHAAVWLARSLVDVGVVTAVCTPHYSRRFTTSHALAGERLRELRTSLATVGVRLELHLAAEVSPALGLIAPLAELEARSIAGRFLIVEVQPDTPVTFFESISSRLGEARLTPVFAHPERSRAAGRWPTVLAAAREQGALVQLVAPSLTGSWGRDVASLAWTLLEGGQADLLGSDAHGPRRAGPELGRAVALVGDRFGDGVVTDLTTRVPALVLAGTHPADEHPS
jgi:protein-tyrosine phosphatase